MDEIAFLLGHRDANVTRAVYVREVADARRRLMRRSRMVAEFGGVRFGSPYIRATARIDLHERAASKCRRPPQELAVGEIHRSVAGRPSGCSRRIRSIAFASVSTVPRVRVRVDGSRINPA